MLSIDIIYSIISMVQVFYMKVIITLLRFAVVSCKSKKKKQYATNERVIYR